MDHATFHERELEAIYDELEGPEAAELRAHATTCASCAGELARLREARERGLSVLLEAVPSDFESRIMAAVDAALARSGTPAEEAAASPVRALPTAGARPSGGGKVLAFLARPSFAVAASFILVLGAAALLLQLGARKLSPMAASMDEAKGGAEGQAVASAMSPPPAAEPGPAATTTSLRTAPSPTPGAPVVAAAPRSPPASAPASPAEAAGGPKLARPSARTAPASKAGESASDPFAASASDPFAAAKSLYDADNCAEALPKFEALKGTHPEAQKYATRCVQKLRQAVPEAAGGAAKPAAPARPTEPAKPTTR